MSVTVNPASGSSVTVTTTGNKNTVVANQARQTSLTVSSINALTSSAVSAGVVGPTGPVGPRQYVSDTPPVSPVTGDQWLNSTNARQYVYYDSYWIEVGAAFRGSPAVYIQATKPVTSEPTYMWVDTSQSSLTVWIEDGT